VNWSRREFLRASLFAGIGRPVAQRAAGTLSNSVCPSAWTKMVHCATVLATRPKESSGTRGSWAYIHEQTA
jgi:hypothetical protein